jgi:hypothetical protein
MKPMINRILAALLLVFGSVVTPGIAQARQVWPARGAAGDQGAQTECPNGQAAVGFNGRAGAWIDAVQLICARPLTTGGYEEAQPTGGLYGGAGGAPSRICDPGLRRAHAMVGRHHGQPVIGAAPVSRYERELLRLAFLAPDIQRDILEGRQPPTITLEKLRHMDIPLCWTEQRRALGWC